MNIKKSTYDELVAVAEWAAKSFHHPACKIARGTGWTMIGRDDCSCHVRAAREALEKIKAQRSMAA